MSRNKLCTKRKERKRKKKQKINLLISSDKKVRSVRYIRKTNKGKKIERITISVAGVDDE
jgi:hypothetical protein